MPLPGIEPRAADPVAGHCTDSQHEIDRKVFRLQIRICYLRGRIVFVGLITPMKRGTAALYNPCIDACFYPVSLCLSCLSHFSCLFSLSPSVAQMKQKSEVALLSNNSSPFPGHSTCSVPLTHRPPIGPLETSRCSLWYKNLFASAACVIVILE